MGNYSLEVDCPSLDFPIPEAGWISPAAATNLGWHFKGRFPLASLFGFGECPFRSRAQFTRLFLPADFGFTIF
jgi:hypothetical protein